MAIFYILAGTGTFTAPSDWPGQADQIECLGSGGNGSLRSSSSIAGTGGGGGEYAAETGALTLADGTSCTVGTAGGTTNTSIVAGGITITAHHGVTGVAGSTGLGGTGSTNTTHFNGGNGGHSTTSVAWGGGGAAGPNGAGSNATSVTGGNADSSTVAGGAGAGASGTEFDGTHGCGAGGAGATSTGNGFAGGLYGGGGGAHGTAAGGTVGAGQAGLIVITYTPASPVTLRPLLYTRRWETDPTGISRRSQDGTPNYLTLVPPDAIFRKPLWVRRWIVDPPGETANGSPLALLASAAVAAAAPPGDQWFELPKSAAQPSQGGGYNLLLTTLAGQDATLAGDQVSARQDLGPAQFVRSASCNLVLTTLRSKDATLAGDQVTARQDLGPPQFIRGAASSLVLTTLAGQDAVLVGEQSFALPIVGAQPGRFYGQSGITFPLPVGEQSFDRSAVPVSPGRFYAQSYQPLLAGVPSLPPGDQWFALPQGAAPLVPGAGSNLLQTTLRGQDATLSGEQSFALGPATVQPDRFYSWSGQTSTLAVAAAARPVGRQQYDPPLWPAWYRQAQNSFFAYAVVIPPQPFAQYDWPSPRVAQRIDESWAQNLVSTTLVGQDATLAGDQSFGNPPSGSPQFVRSWTGSSPIVLFTANPVPFNQYDWPNPRVAGRIDETWVGSLVTTTLAGQDARLAGQQVSDRPPLGPSQFGRSWISQSPVVLFTANPVPFNQYDWPVPKVAARIDETWIQALVSSTLAGQDARLVGSQVYDLPRIQTPPARSWAWNVQVQFLILATPFAQYDWPLPKSAAQPDRSQAGNLVLTTLRSQDARLAGTQSSGRPELRPYQFVRGAERNLLQSTLAPPAIRPVGSQLFLRPELRPYQFVRYAEKNLVLRAFTIPGQPGPVWVGGGTAPAGAAASLAIGLGPNQTYQTRLRSLYLTVSGGSAGMATMVVRDGLLGVGQIIFEADLYTAANSRDVLDFNNIDLRATAGGVLTVEFLGGTPGAVQQISAHGDYVPFGIPYGEDPKDLT